MIRRPPRSTLFPYTNALPISYIAAPAIFMGLHVFVSFLQAFIFMLLTLIYVGSAVAHEHRSEEHTSELQSQSNLVCRLLLEKKKKHIEQPLFLQQHQFDLIFH